MLELHVYGPGLGLPSIEVKCLAAIALLRSCFPIVDNKWTVIPSSNPNISPLNELPALRDGDLWVSGFQNIAEYLKETCIGVDDDFTFSLDDAQSANHEAFLSFIESRGLPLLDLSLYVSSDNYTTVTRAELSRLLLWPQSWTVPQKLRDSARKRSDHLGLSGLDVDAVREQELKKENEGIAAVIPKSLRINKKSVTSLLGSSAEQTRFRLEAVTADFFEPLQEQLGESKNFLGKQITVLDCLAVAVLSQMSIVNVPQPWLSHALQKHGSLWEWTQLNKARFFGAGTIPWCVPVSRSWSTLLFDVLDSAAESIPIQVSNRFLPNTASDRIGEKTWEDTSVAKSKRKSAYYTGLQSYRWHIRGLVTAGITSIGFMGTFIYMGLLVVNWPSRRTGSLRHGFGAAEALSGSR